MCEARFCTLGVWQCVCGTVRAKNKSKSLRQQLMQRLRVSVCDGCVCDVTCGVCVCLCVCVSVVYVFSMYVEQRLSKNFQTNVAHMPNSLTQRHTHRRSYTHNTSASLSNNNNIKRCASVCLCVCAALTFHAHKQMSFQRQLLII